MSKRLGDRLEKMDKEIRAWGRVTKKKLLFRIASLNLDQKRKLAGALQESIKEFTRKKDGDIESVGFSFVRHGIFLEHGVGKGRPVGSPAANAAAKKWLSVVLPKSIDDLANILAENYADIAAEELRFLIPGIIDTKIKI